MLPGLEALTGLKKLAGHEILNADGSPVDINHDGVITWADCPFELGSAAAKKWWVTVVQPHTEASITPAIKAKYGAKVVGVFNGKPLVPGEAGPGQGDFDFLVNKLVVTQGVDPSIARKIAAKVNHNLYG